MRALSSGNVLQFTKSFAHVKSTIYRYALLQTNEAEPSVGHCTQSCVSIFSPFLLSSFLSYSHLFILTSVPIRRLLSAINISIKLTLLNIVFYERKVIHNIIYGYSEVATWRRMTLRWKFESVFGIKI